MADSVRYAISVTPIEVLTNENDGTHEVISSEVNTTLGGDGEATVANYTGTKENQGYKDAAVYYLEAPDGAGGEVAITGTASASFVFIKNTGNVYSSSTALGASETSRLLKVTTNSGAIILAILSAGEAVAFKALQSTAVIAASGIKVETVDSDGSEAAAGTHLAVEFLVVV